MTEIPVTTYTADQIAQDRATVEAATDVLRDFVVRLDDLGMVVQLTEAVTKALFGERISADHELAASASLMPHDLVETAINDVTRKGFDLERVIAGAASLEFLARYASTLSADVFPIMYIPASTVLAAALRLFHHGIDQAKSEPADAGTTQPVTQVPLTTALDAIGDLTAALLGSGIASSGKPVVIGTIVGDEPAAAEQATSGSGTIVTHEE
jgi:hypothetical protein